MKMKASSDLSGSRRTGPDWEHRWCTAATAAHLRAASPVAWTAPDLSQTSLLFLPVWIETSSWDDGQDLQDTQVTQHLRIHCYKLNFCINNDQKCLFFHLKTAPSGRIEVFQIKNQFCRRFCSSEHSKQRWFLRGWRRREEFGWIKP